MNGVEENQIARIKAGKKGQRQQGVMFLECTKIYLKQTNRQIKRQTRNQFQCSALSQRIVWLYFLYENVAFYSDGTCGVSYLW